MFFAELMDQFFAGSGNGLENILENTSFIHSTPKKEEVRLLFWFVQ